MMAMNFAGAAERVRDLLAPKKLAELQKSALPPDKLRDNIVRETAERSEHFQRAVEKLPELSYERTHEDGSVSEEHFDWTAYPEAVRDFARASFGWDEPEVVGRDRMRPSYRLNREVVQGAVGSEWFRESRPYTRNNELESVVGAAAFAGKLQELGAQHLAEHVERSERISEEEERAKDLDQMFDELRERARQEIADTGTVEQGTRREIKRALKAMDANAQTVGELMEQESSSAASARAMAAGAEAAQEASEAVEAIGMAPGIGGGAAHNLPLDKQIELAQRWAENEQLRQIARMLGRMLQVFWPARHARTKHVRIEPVGITTGNELDRLLPQELARAFHPALHVKATFVRDFAQRSLLQYDMEGDAPLAKGPVYTVEDGSGSMSGAPYIWAKSLQLALLTLCARERRPFGSTQFGSRGQIKSWEFLRGEPDPELVLDFATHFFAGGTSTYSGMEEALRVMKATEAFRSADVVLIGDGCDSFGERDRKVREELRALGVRIHGISIMQPNNAYFREMCEWVVDVSDLAGPNEAVTQLAENVT